uniref:Uncharacterized protein n=1 Tax=Anguilla anguilla TaxID=7936 RepID=A0A0E9Q9B0_ANGAN
MTFVKRPGSCFCLDHLKMEILLEVLTYIYIYFIIYFLKPEKHPVTKMRIS